MNTPPPTAAAPRRSSERGQGLAEYGAIVTLIGIFLILAVGALGGSTSRLFAAVASVF